MLWLASLKTQFERQVSLVLAFLLFASQLHLCEPTYVLPTGQRCTTCPEIAKAQTANSSVGSGQKDCRDCCKLTGCNHNAKTAPVVLASCHVVPAILPTVPGFDLCFFTIASPVSVPKIEGIPPTGPPSQDNSRAPPASTLA